MSEPGADAYERGLRLIESGKDDEGIAALVRSEKQGYRRATEALDRMVQPLPGEHPISLENRRRYLREIGS